jgi:hypothetical protein
MSDEVPGCFVLLFAWRGSFVGVMERERYEGFEEEGDSTMVDV